MHQLEFVLAIALLVIGSWRLVAALRRTRQPALRIATAPRRRVDAHQLGLAHRFAARALGSRWRPRDEEFTAVAHLWPTYPIVTPWGVRLTAMWSPELGRFVTPAAAFLELEELLETLERLNARIRNWRPGRRRERR